MGSTMLAANRKFDLREVIGRVTVAAICILTLVVIAVTSTPAVAAYGLLLASAGFLVARWLARRGIAMPIPRSARRAQQAMSYRRRAGDTPFNTRLGWTAGAEPGGTLPDARKVSPYGLYGGGLVADGFAGGLIIAAMLAILFMREPIGALYALFLFGVIAMAGFVLVVVARRLRRR
ncbi:MAG: hypothetical protein ACRD6I_02340 [Candidatus Acidiferrales bacterium]